MTETMDVKKKTNRQQEISESCRIIREKDYPEQKVEIDENNGIYLDELVKDAYRKWKNNKPIIKSIQIGKYVLPDWDNITNIYDKNKVDYNCNHNIMVRNQNMIVETVDKLMEELVKDNSKFAQYIFHKREKVFTILLMMCSKVCCQKGVEEFKKIINNGETIDNLESILNLEDITDLFSSDGLKMDADKKINEKIQELITL